MLTKTSILRRAERLGLQVGTSAPGDGARRYSFERPYDDGATGAVRQVGHGRGAAAAMLWLDGYEAGRLSQG